MESSSSDAQQIPRILFVDDEEDAVNLFKLWCARWGYEALGQTEPKKALETAIAFAPDVLFLDVLMPGFDGFQVLEAIKSDARTRHVPVVMLTGGAIQVPDKVRGLAGGAVDYLTKPIDSREMRARIETYLTLRGDVLAHGRERELRAIRQTAVFLNHSINNLLAGIQAAATLHFEDGDEEAKEREALISENVRAIAGIVQRLREIKHVIGTSYAGLDGELMLDLDRSTKG